MNFARHLPHAVRWVCDPGQCGEGFACTAHPPTGVRWLNQVHVNFV